MREEIEYEDKNTARDIGGSYTCNSREGISTYVHDRPTSEQFNSKNTNPHLSTLITPFSCKYWLGSEGSSNLLGYIINSFAFPHPNVPLPFCLMTMVCQTPFANEVRCITCHKTSSPLKDLPIIVLFAFPWRSSLGYRQWRDLWWDMLDVYSRYVWYPS